MSCKDGNMARIGVFVSPCLSVVEKCSEMVRGRKEPIAIGRWFEERSRGQRYIVYRVGQGTYDGNDTS